MKGNIIHCDPQIEADPATDMVVTRHSADQSDTIHPCFTVSRVDADSMFTIVASNRTGED